MKEIESIEIVCKLLKRLGFTEIIPTQSKDQFCPYDIAAKKGDIEVIFEVKSRNFYSTRYGDLLCEKHKYDEFCKLKCQNPQLVGIIINIFTDNIIGLNFIDQFQREFEFFGPRTTSFQDNNYIKKRGLSYRMLKKYKIIGDEFKQI